MSRARGVGDHRRQLDQRLDPTEGLGEREDPLDRRSRSALGADRPSFGAGTNETIPPPARIWRAAQAAWGWARGHSRGRVGQPLDVVALREEAATSDDSGWPADPQGSVRKPRSARSSRTGPARRRRVLEEPELPGDRRIPVMAMPRIVSLWPAR